MHTLGLVCRNMSKVAVQIIDIQSNAKATMAAVGHEGEEDWMGMPVEALLGMDMAHPNVVQTYRHTSLPSMVSQFPNAYVLCLHWYLEGPALCCNVACQQASHQHVLLSFPAVCFEVPHSVMLCCAVSCCVALALHCVCCVVPYGRLSLLWSPLLCCAA